MKITKKLRDVTPEEYTMYREQCSNRDCNSCPLTQETCGLKECSTYDCWVYNKRQCSKEFLNKEITFEKKKFLKKDEIEYLKKEFKKIDGEVIWIELDGITPICYPHEEEYSYLVIHYIKPNGVWSSKDLPSFKPFTKFNGLRATKKYYLEDIGLIPETYYIEKKLKDVTRYEYRNWWQKRCNNNKNGNHCWGCPLETTECNPHYYNCWVENKGIYNEEFLNNTIVVENQTKEQGK